MSTDLLDDLRHGVALHLAPLTVGQYQRMIQDGILHDAEPIELIEGSLIYKDRRDQTGEFMTHGPRHLRSLNKLTAMLSQWVASKAAFLQVQGPIVIGETSEPEPDCSIVRGTPDNFSESVPSASDVLAVFEVAFSSLASDRRTKQRLYAVGRIPVYVIINLQDQIVEVFSEPSVNDTGYDLQTVFRGSDCVSVNIGSLGNLSFDVDQVA